MHTNKEYVGFEFICCFSHRSPLDVTCINERENTEIKPALAHGAGRTIMCVLALGTTLFYIFGKGRCPHGMLFSSALFPVVETAARKNYRNRLVQSNPDEHVVVARDRRMSLYWMPTRVDTQVLA